MKILDYIKLYWLKFRLLFVKKVERSPGKLHIRLDMVKDPKDDRDYLIEATDETTLPVSFQLPIDPYKYVKNQGKWGSCASHAMATAIEIMHEINNTKFNIPLSERFHYWVARQEKYLGQEYMGTFPENSGQYARIMLKVAQNIGICPEQLCPYISDQMNETPAQMAHGFAHLWRIKHYFRIQDFQSAKETLKNGQPICLGVFVNNSFRNFSGPIDAEGNYSGGHEVVIYGYDDETQEFLCINSWGENYKDKGIMRVPYGYIEKYGIDMWTFTIR